jgi:hypothetical protein
MVVIAILHILCTVKHRAYLYQSIIFGMESKKIDFGIRWQQKTPTISGRGFLLSTDILSATFLPPAL